MSARDSQYCTVPSAIIRLFALANIDSALYKGG